MRGSALHIKHVWTTPVGKWGLTPSQVLAYQKEALSSDHTFCEPVLMIYITDFEIVMQPVNNLLLIYTVRNYVCSAGSRGDGTLRRPVDSCLLD